MHQLYFCRGVIKPTPNESSRYDTKQSDGEAPVLEFLGNVEYPFTAIAHRSILALTGGSNRTV